MTDDQIADILNWPKGETDGNLFSRVRNVAAAARRQALEGAAKVCDEEVAIRTDAGLAADENSPARDRCMSAAKAALNCAAAIRAVIDGR